MTVTATWGGTRGNALSVAILANADDTANVDVVTYLDGAAVDTQTVAKSAGTAGLKANDYVSFGTAAALSVAVEAALTGGTNGTVNGAAHVAALEAFDVEIFQAIG